MNLFIGCSSSSNIPQEYFDDCKLLLEKLMKKYDLVFGACKMGLMGLSHDIALKNNRKIIGISPYMYKDDFKNLSCDVEIVTNSISERTDKVISYSDALIFLPGGIGTVYELFTTIESKRGHEFNKPIIIYNCHGYFDKLLDFMEKIYDENFSNIKDRQNYIITNSVSAILNYLENYEQFKEDTNAEYGEVKSKTKQI